MPATSIPEHSTVEVKPEKHGTVIVMHADCDLLQDFNARLAAKAAGPLDESSSKLVPQALVCDAFEISELRPQIKGSDIWKRITQNQDERYHRLDGAPIGDLPTQILPELILDFRRMYAVFTAELYQAIEAGAVGRMAVVPPIYLQDLMHRFFGYLSRVGLPD